MSSNLESIQSFNFSAIIPTSICFVLGLAYYYYKLRNVSENLRENSLLRNRNEENRQNIQESNINNHSNQSNINSNQNEFSSNSGNSDNFIKIYVIISSERKMFNINKNSSVGEFIRNEVKRNINNLSSNQTIILICQGRRLDETKNFSDYPSISRETVLHCFITNSSTNQSNTNNSSNEQQPQIEDQQAVSIYTIILHSSVLILISFIIITFKTIDGLFSKGTLLLLQFMILLWITQVSKCVAKLILHKKIVYY